MSLRSRLYFGMLWIGVGFCLHPVSTAAQNTTRVRTEENFRATPNGTILGQLDPGTPLTVVSTRGHWLEVDVEGWTWTRSYRQADKDGHNLVLSASAGENLRSSPSGDVLGHLVQGALLDEIERRPGWLHVKRRGWIWAASVTQGPAAESSDPGAGEERSDAVGKNERDDTATSARAERFTRAGPAGMPILTAADGDTIALARPGTELRVVARQGKWARVRLEGWAWLSDADSESGSVGVADSTLTPDVLKKDPDAYRGRVVAWKLQFISLERAEKVRTDFFEGEPYLLTRFGGAEGAFVYVAVPPQRLSEVQGLVPLELLSVTGRVRTGASALTGSPILDLVTLERERKRR